ncbi:MAG: hypothetical protein AAF772_15440, partial [Acidobacteriota bacterium]
MEFHHTRSVARRRCGRGFGWLLVISLLTTLSSGAQAEEYSGSAGLGADDDIPPRQALEEAVADARLRLGVLRVRPWAGLRDLSVVSGDGPDVDDDVTLTVGAGAFGYVRFGARALLALHALPEYVWWADDEDRRQLNGRYGAGLFGTFGRARIELSQRWQTQQGLFSPEIQRLTSQETRTSKVAAVVELSARVGLIARASRVSSLSQDDGDARFEQLDRDADRVGVGVRLTPRSDWQIDLVASRSTVEFDQGARLLDFEDDILGLAVRFDGNRFGATLRLQQHDAEAEAGSVFAGFDELTGRFETRWDLRKAVQLTTSVRRDFGFVVSDAFSHLRSTRYGVSLTAQRASFAIGALIETGEDRYVRRLGAAAGPSRQDDVTSFSVRAGVPLGRIVSIALNATHTMYEPDGAFGIDRDITTVGVSIGRAARPRAPRTTSR